MRTLILYSSNQDLLSQSALTGQISHYICRQLEEWGYPSDPVNVRDQENNPVALDAYDALIVGFSLRRGGTDHRMLRYLKEYRGLLKELPAAFFTVVERDPRKDSDRLDQIRMTESFLEKLDWDPPVVARFDSDAIRNGSHSIGRHMLQWMVPPYAEQEQRRSDSCDWGSVDQFVFKFVDFVAGCKQPSNLSDRHSPVFAQPTRKYSIRHRAVKSRS